MTPERNQSDIEIEQQRYPSLLGKAILISTIIYGIVRLIRPSLFVIEDYDFLEIISSISSSLSFSITYHLGTWSLAIWLAAQYGYSRWSKFISSTVVFGLIVSLFTAVLIKDMHWALIDHSYDITRTLLSLNPSHFIDSYILNNLFIFWFTCTILIRTPIREDLGGKRYVVLLALCVAGFVLPSLDQIIYIYMEGDLRKIFSFDPFILDNIFESLIYSFSKVFLILWAYRSIRSGSVKRSIWTRNLLGLAALLTLKSSLFSVIEVFTSDQLFSLWLFIKTLSHFCFWVFFYVGSLLLVHHATDKTDLRLSTTQTKSTKKSIFKTVFGFLTRIISNEL